jgi:YaiO family outer membrane protein
MRTLLLTVSFMISGLFPSWGQTSDPLEPNVKPPLEQQPQTSQIAASSEKTNWHFELGGSLALLNNNYGQWYSGETKIAYTGSKYFKPNLSFGSQTRPEGTQQAYGVGSYINFGKYAYAIVGTGVAPNHGTILFPSFRYDLMGVFRVPPVKGLLMTAGYTSYRMGGGNAKIASIGSIYYYRKVVLDGGISFNRSYPGNLPSKSGYLSLMTGRQGKYWFGAGASGGNLNYQLLGIIPYNVRSNAFGFSQFFQKWLGRKWGLVERYYFADVIDQYISNSIGVTLFYDF